MTETKKEASGLLNMEEAAAYLSIKKGTLYIWVMKGMITVVKLGKLNRFRREDLDDYIKSKVVEAT